MRRSTAIGIDDDFAPCQATVAIGAADEELTRRIDVPHGVGGNPTLRQGVRHVWLDDLANFRRWQVFINMLMRDHDLRDADGLAILIAYRHLALGVGTKAGRSTFLSVASRRQVLQNLVCIVDRRRH